MPPKIEPFSKIVVALSGPLINPRVIHEAVRLSTLLDARLYAVHMKYPKAGELTMMMDPLPLYKEEDLRQHFRERGYEELAETIPIKIVEGTNVAKLLRQVTEDTDLLIMGHKQRNRLLAALSSNVVELQILDVVSCPVLVVPKSDQS